ARRPETSPARPAARSRGWLQPDLDPRRAGLVDGAFRTALEKLDAGRGRLAHRAGLTAEDATHRGPATPGRPVEPAAPDPVVGAHQEHVDVAGRAARRRRSRGQYATQRGPLPRRAVPGVLPQPLVGAAHDDVDAPAR